MDFADLFGTAAGIGADSTYAQDRNPDTVPTNALQSMQPVVADDGESWSGFWRDLASGVLTYAVAKDAAKTTAQLQQQARAPAPVQTASTAGFAIPPGLVMLLLAGGAMALAVKVLK
jgi:hypothetical protein